MTRRNFDAAKRVVDLMVASVALVVSLPLQAAVAVVVWRDLGRPVLFRQPRPGKDGRVFHLVKFRTMHAPTDTRIADGERLTPAGRMLRAASLDELPTFWNVLRGEMSLVGPRPLLVEYLERYTPEQSRRHEVLPGVTGLAQVSGRNTLSWDEKLALDVHYVDHRSPGLDFSILVRTVAQVIRRTGISAEGHATAPEFTGTVAADSQEVDARDRT